MNSTRSFYRLCICVVCCTLSRCAFQSSHPISRKCNANSTWKSGMETVFFTPLLCNKCPIDGHGRLKMNENKFEMKMKMKMRRVGKMHFSQFLLRTCVCVFAWNCELWMECANGSAEKKKRKWFGSMHFISTTCVDIFQHGQINAIFTLAPTHKPINLIAIDEIATTSVRCPLNKIVILQVHTDALWC